MDCVMNVNELRGIPIAIGRENELKEKTEMCSPFLVILIAHLSFPPSKLFAKKNALP